MNVTKAFGEFNKSGRVVEKLVINPKDLETVGPDKSYNSGKYYKYTAEVILDNSIPVGSCELISVYPTELRKRF